MEEQLQQASLFRRDRLHRSIYDYFRWCSWNSNNSSVVPFLPSKKTNVSEQPVEAPAPDLHDVTPLMLDSNFDGTAEQQLGGGMHSVGDGTTNELDIPAAPSVYQEKFQRVLALLEHEFPELQQLPAEELEGKPCSELEMRYSAYPDLEKRLQARSLEGEMAELPIQPLALVPAANSHHNNLEGGAEVIPTLGGVGLLLENKTDLGPVEAMNSNKRKTPPTHSDQDEDQKAAKKLKEQAKEIRTLKSQLQLFQRAQHTTAAAVIRAPKKVRGSTTASLESAKERAMAAAVPFEERFQELVHYSSGYGHCRIPCTNKENPGLARWVQSLRAAYKEKKKRGNSYYGQLTDERMAQLEGIGFEWSVQAPKASWDTRFEQLVKFKQENGHCRVVRSYIKNPALGEWVHRQRYLAHKNQLDPEKVQQLTNLGFEIWVRTQGKSWDDHFEMLLEHRRKNDNLKVPPPDTRTKVQQVLKTSSERGESGGPGGQVENISPEFAGDQDVEGGGPKDSADEQAGSGPNGLNSVVEEYKEEQAFRRWVVSQRDNYHLKYKKGIKSTLNKARVKQLDSIGFDWTREGGENDLRKIRTGALHHRNDPEIWNRRFQELVDYKKQFGDSNIPKEWSENKSLGAWVATQRKMYKALLSGERSSLTPERRTALENIGFSWILRPSRTRPKVLEATGTVAML